MAKYELIVVAGPSDHRYRGLVVRSNPLAYWRLGEAAGASTAVDEMGSFNLTKTGSPIFGVDGRIPGNTAVEFFGNTADHLSNTSFTPALQGNVTFGAWVKLDVLGSNRFIIVKGSATAQDWNISTVLGNQARLSMFDTSNTQNVVQSTTALVVGAWYFLVCTWDGTRLRVYLNGGLEGTSGALSVTPRDGGNVLRVGRNITADFPWDGIIDDPFVLDRALTARDIKQMWIEGPLAAGQRVAELEAATLDKLIWRLNRAGSGTFKLPTNDAKAEYLDLMGRREVQIWREGTLLGWLVPWRQRGTPKEQTYECEGLWSYSHRRKVKTTQTFDDVDQLTIGWNLVSYAQTQSAEGDLNIDSATFSPSGVARDRTYPADEKGTIGELVEAFADINNGFDFDIEIFGDGRREWTPYYPSKGTLRSELVLEWGRNIIDYNFARDGVRAANEVFVTGQGDGPSKLEGSASDVPAGQLYTLLTDVQADSSVTDTGLLTAKAQEAVRLRKVPISLPTITVTDYPEPLIGVLKTGDRVPVRIDDGATQINDTFRIIEMALDPNKEEMQLTLNPA